MEVQTVMQTKNLLNILFKEVVQIGVGFFTNKRYY